MAHRAALIVLAACVTSSVPAAAQVEDAVRLLNLSPDDDAALRRGDVVARVHDAEDRTEVHSVAAVRVRSAPAAFAACAADPRCLKRNADVVEVGAFAARPAAADLAGLSLDPRHAGILERCRVGRCELRLPEEVIAEARALDWKAPGVRGPAAQMMREFLARYAARYLDRGHDGLPVLADRKAPVSSAASTRELAARPFALLEFVPRLRAHVRDPGNAAPPGTSYLYWYKERFYRKLLLAVHHVAIASAPGPHGDVVVAASKQVVATNYMNSAMEVTAFLPGPGGEGVIAYESRARTDIRPSGFSGVERVLLRRLIRGRLEDQLGALRDRLLQHPLPAPAR